MYSLIEKRVTWKRVMMRSWTGLTLPRTAPKATQTEPTQKSALMRLWGDRSGEGLRPQQEVALKLWAESELWSPVGLGLWSNFAEPQFHHLG